MNRKLSDKKLRLEVKTKVQNIVTQEELVSSFFHIGFVTKKVFFSFIKTYFNTSEKNAKKILDLYVECKILIVEHGYVSLSPKAHKIYFNSVNDVKTNIIHPKKIDRCFYTGTLFCKLSLLFYSNANWQKKYAGHYANFHYRSKKPVLGIPHCDRSVLGAIAFNNHALFVIFQEPPQVIEFFASPSIRNCKQKASKDLRSITNWYFSKKTQNIEYFRDLFYIDIQRVRLVVVSEKIYKPHEDIIFLNSIAQLEDLSFWERLTT